MKKLLTTATLLVCSLLTGFAQFSGSGSGTESDPYKIYNPDQLHQVRNYLGQSGVVFQLMADIDLASWISNNNGSQGWEPIGVESQPFMGVFNGNGKKLTGFSISRSTTNYVGFFGYISGATIKNLTIEGDVAGHNYVAAFVGRGAGDCTLTGLTHNGTITANACAGHIAGQYSGSISNASANGNVTSAAGLVGGIVGNQDTSGKTISNVQMTGNVTCTGNPQHVGGIAGRTYAAISNATFTGNVTAKTKTGGICGETCANITGTTVNGTVKGSDYTGGICGVSEGGDLTNCFSYSDVTGTNYVGGVLGESNGNLTKCASFGKISGASFVGGVIGGFGPKEETTPELCRYRHYLTSSRYYYYDDSFDGFTASISKSISNCYAIGNISATGGNAGGICGYTPLLYTWSKSKIKDVTLSDGDDYDKKGVTTKVYSTQTFTTYKYNVQLINFTVSDNYYSGNITGADNVGGILGSGNNVTLSRNYANANITGKNYVGGIVGNILASVKGQIQYYEYYSGTLYNVSANSNCPCASALNNNMALNASVVATANGGRIYGSKGESGVTVAANGSTNDNRALETGQLVISGVTKQVVDSEQDGVNNGIAYFKQRQNYVSHGWDFNNNWTILDTECFPYKPWQAAPPTVSGNPVSGATSISGSSTDGGTVYVTIGQGEELSASCASGNSWSLTGLAALQSGADISLYAKVNGKQNSYRTLTTVGFPGSGTEADPWRIYSAADLRGVYKAGYYKQMNDIDLTSWILTNSKTAGWIPVGYSGTDPVVYDGDNHKVTGLWVNSTEDYAGLFSSFSKGTIRNLTVEATAKQVKGGNYVGIVIGRIGSGTIENVTAKGNVSAKKYVGGIAGYTDGTSLQHLAYTGQLTATGFVGGITSYANTSSTITECAANDVVIKASASLFVGGLIAYPVASFSRCSATGTITLSGTHSNAWVGGLTGYSGEGKTISECFANVTISSASQNGHTAGLVADNSGTIRRCYTVGSVASTGTGSYAGGLVAKASAASKIEDCYSTADVSGNQYTAGLVAYNYGKVGSCYAAGNVSSIYYGAGLVGTNDGSAATTENSVALCPKIEVSDESGWGVRVVGNFKNGASEPVMEGLLAWKDMQVSVNGTPKTVYDDPLEGTAITTVQCAQRDTYEALYWDFDGVWSMSSTDYPTLTWVLNANKIAGVSLDRNSMTIEVGTTGTLTASITPAAAAGSALTWSSSNEQVATVANGVVTGVSLGTAVITVTAVDDNSITATCQVTIVTNRAEAIAALRSLVSEAQALYNNSTEGDEPGEYAADVRRALLAAINTANASITESMSLDEVAEVRTYLEAAMETFSSSVNGSGEVTDISQMENAIYIEPFTAKAGITASVELKLKNSQDIAAYSFDLILPEGVTLAKNAKGKFVYTLDEDRHDEHSATINENSGNVFSVAVLSVSGGELSGSDGTVITLWMVLDESMEEGTYPIVIKNARYSLPNGQLVEVGSTTTALTIENVIVGDVNNNGSVDIGDAVCIINHIVGKENAVFVERAADMNGNGNYGEIGDAVSVVNVIVGKTTVQSASEFGINLLDPQ